MQCMGMYQGCPQDVKSQDRDETETLNPQDRDETFQKNVSRPPRDQDARPRRSKKNVSRPQCPSLETPTGEICHLKTCFLRVRSIIFLVIYSHCMHVHKTKVTRPRLRRYIFKTETRRSKKRLQTASRPRRSRPRLHP